MGRTRDQRRSGVFGTRGAHVTARVTCADRGERARSVERPRQLAWGKVIHAALRVAESTKSMNYALCSIRCDRSVAELVHEPGLVNCARRQPGGAESQWPPPPRQRCRRRGRGSSLPSSAAVGFVNCAGRVGAGVRHRGGPPRGACRVGAGSLFSVIFRTARSAGGRPSPRVDSH